MWAECYEGKHNDTNLNLLAEIIKTTLGSDASAVSKEYDGWVVSKMLHFAAGEPDPTPEEHYNDINDLLQGTPVVKNAWIKGLKQILEKNDLFIYHDIALDPMVDDYLALKIINDAYGKLKEEEDQEEKTVVNYVPQI